MKKQAHVISHSHWDREWYLPYEKPVSYTHLLSPGPPGPESLPQGFLPPGMRLLPRPFLLRRECSRGECFQTTTAVHRL